MYKKIIEYLIIISLIILIIYSCYSFLNYSYYVNHDEITDAITMNYPVSSQYNIVNDTVEFRNSYYAIYDMDVSRLESSNPEVADFLKHINEENYATIDYKNETCYLITAEYTDNNGFNYHSMIIPVKSFSKDDLSFTKKDKVYVFNGNNRDFVVHTAFDSQVII